VKRNPAQRWIGLGFVLITMKHKLGVCVLPS
jgi:hypothetical protein